MRLFYIAIKSPSLTCSNRPCSKASSSAQSICNSTVNDSYSKRDKIRASLCQRLAENNDRESVGSILRKFQTFSRILLWRLCLRDKWFETFCKLFKILDINGKIKIIMNWPAILTCPFKFQTTTHTFATLAVIFQQMGVTCWLIYDCFFFPTTDSILASTISCFFECYQKN